MIVRKRVCVCVCVCDFAAVVWLVVFVPRRGEGRKKKMTAVGLEEEKRRNGGNRDGGKRMKEGRRDRGMEDRRKGRVALEPKRYKGEINS